ncbi:hypothetical protein NOVOSPHI9U_40133 [Novosphingobium sp. 9U]|nr:hypothetical protein NOVOSPHI9U_40133 [Novosphingobium sp. 9U]
MGCVRLIAMALRSAPFAGMFLPQPTGIAGKRHEDRGLALRGKRRSDDAAARRAGGQSA